MTAAFYQPASMGPRPFGQGKAAEWAHLLHALPASMGPRPFGQGKPSLATIIALFCAVSVRKRRIKGRFHFPDSGLVWT